jgi:hypothetical protein
LYNPHLIIRGILYPLQLQRIMCFGSYKTAWSWLHKLRAAMVRRDREPRRQAEADAPAPEDTVLQCQGSSSVMCYDRRTARFILCSLTAEEDTEPPTLQPISRNILYVITP